MWETKFVCRAIIMLFMSLGGLATFTKGNEWKSLDTASLWLFFSTKDVGNVIPYATETVLQGGVNTITQ